MLNFPSSPTIGQQHTVAGKSWEWTGAAWKSISTTIALVERAEDAAAEATASAAAAAQVEANMSAISTSLADAHAQLDGFGAADGAGKVGNGGETVKDSLDALQLPDYAALRAYKGPRKLVYVYSAGIAGPFRRRPAGGATAVDNGGTTIVGEFEWDRVFDGATNAEWFGAKFDGVTDDAAAIQAANDYCDAVGGILALPPKTAIIKSPIKLSRSPWRGVHGRTKIVVASDFAYSANVGQGLAALANKNFSLAYNANTADYIDIRGVDFQLEQTTGASKSLIVLANVRGGVIEDVNALTNTTAMTGSLLDLYACVKNVDVRRSTFDNLTQAAAGGAVWVRNIAADGSVAANVTENITFDEHCRFTTTTLDEAIAVYGVRGKTRNIKVKGRAVGGASPVKHGTLVSAFPLNDGSASGAYAAVEDVTLSLDIVDDNFNDHVIRVGRTEDAAQLCENVKVEKCNINVKQSAVRTSYVVRFIKNIGDGNTVEGCHVDATGSPQVITHAISGADHVTKCTTLGNITNATESCRLVSNNPSLAAAVGAFNSRNVRGNRIFATSIGVVQNSTFDGAISANHIEMAASGTAGVFFNTLGNSTAPAGEINGNAIVMANASGFAVQVSGSTPGAIRAINNKVTGTGKTITGKFEEISGNSWYGKLDERRATPYLDYDHNYATPIGTIMAYSTPVMGATRMKDRAIKTANAGTAADWKDLYAETTAN